MKWYLPPKKDLDKFAFNLYVVFFFPFSTVYVVHWTSCPVLALLQLSFHAFSSCRFRFVCSHSIICERECKRLLFGAITLISTFINSNCSNRIYRISSLNLGNLAILFHRFRWSSIFGWISCSCKKKYICIWKKKYQLSSIRFDSIQSYQLNSVIS